MKGLLEKTLAEAARYTECGEVANYIPELAKASRSDLGACIITASGEMVCAGDYEKPFTMQSVVKPIILLLALADCGRERVEALCGVEATGKPFDAFNYSDRALTGEHINPMVNAGAIALCTLINGDTGDEKFARLLDLARRLSGTPNMDVDEAVYLSEKATGNKNRALAYMLKAYKMIDCDIESLLDVYFKACSIRATCTDLARIALAIGRCGEPTVSAEDARYVSSIMAICGMYDGSGEFALRVGVPAKSGVGGGIMAAVPHKMGIGIYSPALDKKGNSCAGVKVLEMLSRELDLGVF